MGLSRRGKRVTRESRRTIRKRTEQRSQGGRSQEVSKRLLASQTPVPNLRNWRLGFGILNEIFYNRIMFEYAFPRKMVPIFLVDLKLARTKVAVSKCLEEKRGCGISDRFSEAEVNTLRSSSKVFRVTKQSRNTIIY